jgi:hypothetical protein
MTSRWLEMSARGLHIDFYDPDHVTGRSHGLGPAGVGQDGDRLGAEVPDDLALLRHPPRRTSGRWR